MGAGQNKSLPLTAFSHWMHLWILLNRQYKCVVAISCIVDTELFHIYSIEKKKKINPNSIRRESSAWLCIWYWIFIFTIFFLSILRSRFKISHLKSLHCITMFNHTQDCTTRVLVMVQWQEWVYNDLTNCSLFATVAAIQWLCCKLNGNI